MHKSLNPDYLQIASGHFLTNYLPDNHLEMEHDALIKYAEDNAYYIVEDLSGEEIWREIDSLAHTLEVTARPDLVLKGQIHRRKSITHGNPDIEVGGLVTVDYVDVTFKAEDWYALTGE